jgi:hypothetical protein
MTTLHAPDFLRPGDVVVASPRSYTVATNGTIEVADTDAAEDLERLELHGFTHDAVVAYADRVEDAPVTDEHADDAQQTEAT